MTKEKSSEEELQSQSEISDKAKKVIELYDKRLGDTKYIDEKLGTYGGNQQKEIIEIIKQEFDLYGEEHEEQRKAIRDEVNKIISDSSRENIGIFLSVTYVLEMIKSIEEILFKRLDSLEGQMDTKPNKERFKDMENQVDKLNEKLDGIEGRLVKDISLQFSQDFQRLAKLEGKVPENLATQLTDLQTGLVTLKADLAILKERIPENFSDKFLNKGLFLTVTGTIAGIVIAAVSLPFWGIYERLGTVESNYSTLNERFDTKFDALNGRLDTLQNFLLDRQKQEDSAPSSAKE